MQKPSLMTSPPLGSLEYSESSSRVIVVRIGVFGLTTAWLGNYTCKRLGFLDKQPTTLITGRRYSVQMPSIRM